MNDWFKIVMLVASINLSAEVFGSEKEADTTCCLENYKFYLGTDVSAWALGGYSFIYSSVGEGAKFMLEAWSIDVPSAIIDLNKENKGKGWSREIERGYSAHIDTFYNGKENGWYSGIIFSVFDSKISLDSSSQSERLRSYEALLKFGYKWV